LIETVEDFETNSSTLLVLKIRRSPDDNLLHENQMELEFFIPYEIIL